MTVVSGALLQFITLTERRDERGRRRFFRWNAATHKCVTDEQHQRWMKEQAEEIQRHADYRLRVGTTQRMRRVLGLDGREVPVPPRTEPEVMPVTPEALPVQAPAAEPLVLIDYSGRTPLPDISAMLCISAGSR